MPWSESIRPCRQLCVSCSAGRVPQGLFSLYLLSTTLIGAFLATMCLFWTYCWSCGTSHVMLSTGVGARGQAPICGIPSFQDHHLNSAISKQAIQTLTSMPVSIGRLTFGSGSQGTRPTSSDSYGIRQRRIMVQIGESDDEIRLPTHYPSSVSYIRLINTSACIYHPLPCLISSFSLLLTPLRLIVDCSEIRHLINCLKDTFLELRIFGAL